MIGSVQGSEVEVSNDTEVKDKHLPPARIEQSAYDDLQALCVKDGYETLSQYLRAMIRFVIDRGGIR
jgi:hypothetical protein